MANRRKIYPGKKLFCKSLKYTQGTYGTCEEMEVYINNFVTVIKLDRAENSGVEVQKPNDDCDSGFYLLDLRDLEDPDNFSKTIEVKNLPKIQSTKKARFNPELLVL